MLRGREVVGVGGVFFLQGTSPVIYLFCLGPDTGNSGHYAEEKAFWGDQREQVEDEVEGSVQRDHRPA